MILFLTIQLWDVVTGKCKQSIETCSPILAIVFHTDSGLIATFSEDMCIRVIDIDTYKIVREFSGHFGKITDIVSLSFR
jgi:U3 small nucleolar RNA-associated protein 21